MQLERIASRVELRVIDTGEGLNPDFLPLVSERFGQTDSSTRRRHGGIGIGLSVVTSLVEMHGGSVRAFSPGEGKGATMVATLPLEAAQDGTRQERRSAKCASPSVADLPVLSGVRVLIVDDDPDARDMIKILLDARKAVTASTGSVGEAVRLLESFRPDLVLSDIDMPNEDGYDLIRIMRARDIGTPAVALTAFARADDRIRSMQAGYKAHLVTPVEPLELMTVIASVIGRY